MKLKRISFAAVTLALLMTLSVSAATAPSASSGSSSATSSQNAPQHKPHCGGDFGAMKALSKITGTSVEDLTAKYPQKTSWQIAKKLGKLDALKKEYLAEKKAFLDKLTADGKMTADKAAKIYQELQKRVAAIDGVNTVILGRPSMRPESKPQ